MILPIVAYGDPLLKRESEDITKDYPALDQLIKDMYETMYHAKGVGLAAPQIGLNIRLFIVDGAPFADEEGDELLIRNECFDSDDETHSIAQTTKRAPKHAAWMHEPG